MVLVLGVWIMFAVLHVLSGCGCSVLVGLCGVFGLLLIGFV